jgi:hypothetical protein
MVWLTEVTGLTSVGFEADGSYHFLGNFHRLGKADGSYLTFLYVGKFLLYIFVYYLLHRLLSPILQSGGCIMYSYTFHIMKYYLYYICVIFVQTTSLTSAVKDFV